MGWETPKTDWTVNPKAPEPTDFNRIEGNIDFLKSDIETKKGLIVDAMNSIGVEADISDTFGELASKIAGINRKRYASGSLTSNPLSIRGLEFKPSIVIVRSYGYVYIYRDWTENFICYYSSELRSGHYYTRKLYRADSGDVPGRLQINVFSDFNNSFIKIYDDGFDCTMPLITGSSYDFTGGGWFACE